MLSIPIVSSFDNKGIKKAVQEFKQLETVGQKAQFALRKATIPATAALAGLGAALFDATKGAMEDAAAQGVLARQLQRSTKATDAQIKANEEWISTQGELLGVTDDELRPALAGLARVTGSITKAQKATSLAMDISAAKGVQLSTVTKALERAYGGNLTAIARIAPEFRTMIKEGATLEQVMAKLAQKFGGEASAAAQTTEGKMRRLTVSLNETKESIGASLLPALEATLPYLQQFSDWASKNPELFKNVALAIGGITVATIALNAAMAVNPYVAAAAGLVALAVAVDKVYKAAEKMNGLKGVGLKVLTLIFGGSFGAMKVTEDLFGGLRDRFSDRAPAAPSPSSPSVLPSMLAPVIPSSGASMADRGYMVTVNTGIGDPAAIGKTVSDVLNFHARRSQ